MKLQQSGALYLETIYILHNQTGFVRSVDIANALGFSKPSVSHAVARLKQSGYILSGSPASQILLTETGCEAARLIHERRCLLANALTALGISPATARADACKIEHALSEESFEKIRQHAQTGRVRAKP